ncbi:hypothetical protein P171DRAFT_449853 [Karstenula rhodostoma CBS 690.94]|uniref:Uncharacterized protein n=1 Tax=Karstenula rhodostoma CBS 690.94 TaxID=1392251 RepID=A0A9P4P3I3_9PLEO|nr:hypothetical protein P171DRAFT_449853 [Karstenula rhodostoma CBS 690.94]
MPAYECGPHAYAAYPPELLTLGTEMRRSAAAAAAAAAADSRAENDGAAPAADDKVPEDIDSATRIYFVTPAPRPPHPQTPYRHAAPPYREEPEELKRLRAEFIRRTQADAAAAAAAAAAAREQAPVAGPDQAPVADGEQTPATGREPEPEPTPTPTPTPPGLPLPPPRTCCNSLEPLRLPSLGSWPAAAVEHKCQHGMPAGTS